MRIRTILAASVAVYDNNGDAYELEIITKGGAILTGPSYQFGPEDDAIRIDVKRGELEAAECYVLFSEIAAFVVIPR